MITSAQIFMAATCKCKEYDEVHDKYGPTDVPALSAPLTDKPLNIIWEEPEDLVTANDVSSTMFTDPVETAVEAPPEPVPRKVASQQKPMVLLTSQNKPLVLIGMDRMKGRVRRIRDWFEKKHRLRFSQTRMEDDDERVEAVKA